MDTTPRYGDCDNTLLFKIAESLNAGGGGSGGPFLPLTGGILSGNLTVGNEATPFPAVQMTVQDSRSATTLFVNNLFAPSGAAGAGGNAQVIIRSTTLASYGWRFVALGSADQLLIQDEDVGTRAWIPGQANAAFGIGEPAVVGVLLHVATGGVLMLTNPAGTDFSRLQFGGSSSSFPALKRAATVLSVVLADDSAGAPVLAESYRVTATNVNAQTGTSYQLDATDNGKVVTLDNANPIALTVPSGLGAGFSCTLIQIGAGQVTVGTSGTTVNSYTSLVKLAGQHAAATLYAYAADVFNLSGNLSA